MSLRAQQDTLSKIVARIRSGREQIAAVDVDLKPEARRDRIQAIRETS